MGETIGPMKLAYLLNTYPMTSTTFIRREVEAVERTGVPVLRFAVRPWPEKLVDPEDQRERERTDYLMQRLHMLPLAVLQVVLQRPLAFGRALAGAVKLASAPRANRIRPFAYLAQAALLFLKTRKAGVDHVHAHFSTNAAAVAMLCRLMGGPTYSFTVHGPDELMDPASLSLAFKAANARSVIAITRYCRAKILEHVAPADAERVHIVPCGLDLERMPEDPRPVTADMNLVCVGRLCPQKGQIHIPAAVARLRERFPDLRVRLIGDGESRAAIEEEIARHDVASMVRLSGWGSNEEVRNAILASRALLLPSYHEGLPIVIMEAFALRRPVITTRIAGIPELVDGSCGWIVNSGDLEALICAMAEALAAPASDLQRKGAEGRRRVEAHHDLATIAPRLLEAIGFERDMAVADATRPARASAIRPVASSVTGR